MATVLHFPVPPSGDWTPSERARLNELAARVAEQADVQVVFGRSDSGDPWCVVLDAQDEVLVHVAREGGGFVAHAAAADVFVRSTDLRTAVDRVLGSRWLEERSDVVVPFASGSRAVQMLSAVLIVGSFVEHHRADAEPADEWIFAAARPLKPGARDSQRDDAAKVAPAADAPPAGAHQPSSLPAVSIGADPAALPFAPAADLLAGGDFPTGAPGQMGRELAARLIAASAESEAAATADIVVGTPGDDRLDGGGAPPGMHDLLDAGAGDDWLLLDGGTIAIGGDGADRFLVGAPGSSADLPLLGVIADFDPAVDRLLTANSPTVTVVATLPTRNIFADPNVDLAEAPALPGAQLVVDLDGDGRGDGYLLVNSVEPGAERLEAIRQILTELNAPPTSVAGPAVTTTPPSPAATMGPEAEPRPSAEPPSSRVDFDAGTMGSSLPASVAEPAPEAKKPPLPVSTLDPGSEAKPSPVATAEPEARRSAPPAPGPEAELEVEAPPQTAFTAEPELDSLRSMASMMEPADHPAMSPMLEVI